MKEDTSLHREDMIIQSKCGIRQGYYDLSKEHILASVDQILQRLQTEYLDILLLHRPDALVEPEEVAEAFRILEQSGKVRHFGVSNHKPMQIELLQQYVDQPLMINQMQFSIPVSNMVANGMEVNMETPGAADRDGSVLDYCRLHNITIQAWSPFQMPNWKGCFLGSEEYSDLNMVQNGKEFDLQSVLHTVHKYYLPLDATHNNHLLKMFLKEYNPIEHRRSKASLLSELYRHRFHPSHRGTSRA